jgi:hypothetical protein
MVSIELARTFASLITKIAATHAFSEHDAQILQNVMNQHIKEGGVSGGGGTGNYPDLDNKPTINGITIQGNMTPGSLGLASETNLNAHVNNTTVHITNAERVSWNSRVESVAAALGELFVSVNNLDARNPRVQSTGLLQQAVTNANSAIQQAQLDAAIAAHEANINVHGDIRNEIQDIIVEVTTALTSHNSDTTAHQHIQDMVNNLEFIKSVENNNGILTFTFKDNSILTVNLIADSLDLDIEYLPATKEIILKSEGVEIGRVNISDLVDTYYGSDGAHIQIVVDAPTGEIRAILKAGTVTKTELHADLVTEIEGKLNKNLGAENADKILTVGLDGEVLLKDEIEMTAENVSYDNTESGLVASNVQEAIDELKEELDNKTVEVDNVTIIGDGNEDPLEVQISAELKNAVTKEHDGLWVLDKEAKDVPYDNTVTEMLATNVQEAIDEIDGIVNDLAEELVELDNKVKEHIEDEDVHVTKALQEKWNKTTEDFETHESDNDIHVTLIDKENWNNKVDKTDENDKIYGTNESGEQVVYDKDDFVSKDVWLPNVDADGNITFVRDSTETPPQSANIKGMKGDDGYTFVPDWTNEQTVNRISTSGGQWTVINDGFIHVTGRFENTGRLNVIIQGGSHFFIVPVSGWTDSRIFPVAKDDVVQIVVENGVLNSLGCYFIPPRFVVPS